MRRAKAKLTVSTFPFLAVLLCAMGALILLLLVFDRRAKEAAKARAEARAQAEHDSARAEHEQKLKKILAMDVKGIQDDDVIAEPAALIEDLAEAIQNHRAARLDGAALQGPADHRHRRPGDSRLPRQSHR